MTIQADHSLPPTRLLTPAEVERFYGFKILRLQEWRARGGGPAWHKIGSSCLYRVDALEAFLAATAVAPRSRESRDV